VDEAGRRRALRPWPHVVETTRAESRLSESGL